MRSFFTPTAESFGVAAEIGSGVVRGVPEVRFHEGSTRVPPRVPRGLHEVLGRLRGASTKRARRAVGISPEFTFQRENIVLNQRHVATHF